MLENFSLMTGIDFEGFKPGQVIYLDIDRKGYKEYKIVSVTDNGSLLTDPESPVNITLNQKQLRNDQSKKIIKSSYYSRFSKHYSHK